MPTEKKSISVKSFIKKWQRDEDGSTAMIYAIILPVLIGMGALAVEAGHYEQRNARIQGAADMAAIAVALEYQATNDRDKADFAGRGDAIENGYVAEGGSIEIESPIVTGPFAGREGARVRIEQKQDRFLSAIFPSQKDIVQTVEATVVAGLGAGTPVCVLALNENDGAAIEVTGSADVELQGCGFHSNSTNPNAINFQGNGNSFSGQCLSAVGGVSGEDPDDLVCDEALENTAPVVDPYADVMVDQSTVSSLPCESNVGRIRRRDSVTLGPSVPGGAVRLCNQDINLQGTLSLQPGTYYFDNSTIGLNSGAVFSANPPAGVTIIFTNGGGFDGNINGGATLNLRAQSTGPFAGIAIFQDPDTSTEGARVRLNGNSSSSIEGVIYYPNQNIEFRGGASVDSGCTQIIANTVSFSGNSGFTVDNCEPLGVRDLNGPGAGRGVKLVN